jgi:hypothetical protein
LARDRQRPLKVWVSQEERAQVEARAKSTGLSLSAFLRAAGLGLRPKSVYDLEAVDQLAKVGADLGRLGGLLKLWLATKKEEGASARDVDRLLGEIRGMQQRMLKLMNRV